MALSLDTRLTEATPPETPLDMPVQDLKAWAGKPASVGNGGDVALARLFVFGTSGLITAFGTWKMYEVISPVNVTVLQVLFADPSHVTNEMLERLVAHKRRAGATESLAGAYVSSGLKDLVVYVLFLAILLFKPAGLFGKSRV